MNRYAPASHEGCWGVPAFLFTNEHRSSCSPEARGRAGCELLAGARGRAGCELLAGARGRAGFELLAGARG